MKFINKKDTSTNKYEKHATPLAIGLSLLLTVIGMAAALNAAMVSDAMTAPAVPAAATETPDTECQADTEAESIVLTIRTDDDWVRWSNEGPPEHLVTEAIIEEGVTIIPRWFFAGCTRLESIRLPDSLYYIGGHAFEECRELSSVYIGKSLNYIGGGAFNDCSPDLSITVDPGNPNMFLDNGILYSSNYTIAYWCSPSLENIVFHPDTKIIAPYAALTTRREHTISLPEGLVVIGYNAFCSWGKLQSSELPASLVEIGEGALECLDMEELTLSSAVQFSDGDIMSWCLLPEGLRRLIVKGTGLLIEDAMFCGLEQFEQLVFCDGKPTIYYPEQDPFRYYSEKTNRSITIYYLNKNKTLWAPNGETEWLGAKLVGIDSLDDLPPLS